jgi:hypothetical protein
MPLLAGHIFRSSIKGISSPLSLGFGAYNSATVVSSLGVGGSDGSGNFLMNKNDFEHSPASNSSPWSIYPKSSFPVSISHLMQ